MCHFAEVSPRLQGCCCKAGQVWHSRHVILQMKGWQQCTSDKGEDGPLLQHPLLPSGGEACHTAGRGSAASLQGSQLPLLRLQVTSALRHH